MSRTDDYVRVLGEGRTASPGAVNPYVGDVVLAKIWLRGYQSMLKRTFWESPSQQPYVEALPD